MYLVEVWDMDRDMTADYWWCKTLHEAIMKADEFLVLYPDSNRFEISYEQRTKGFVRYGH